MDSLEIFRGVKKLQPASFSDIKSKSSRES